MIISHDRKALFIGVPKNGSQTARAVLGQFGVNLVAEMGRHPTVPEAVRLAEARFPGEVIAPTNIFAFWRDPVERFSSAVAFHKRCLPNSFVQLFPDRFEAIESHIRWFEPDPDCVAAEVRSVIDNISPSEILNVLPPPYEVRFCVRGANLTFYRPQARWLRWPGMIVIPFAHYERRMRAIVDDFGGDGELVSIPQMNQSIPTLHDLTADEHARVCSYYAEDVHWDCAA